MSTRVKAHMAKALRPRLRPAVRGRVWPVAAAALALTLLCAARGLGTGRRPVVGSAEEAEAMAEAEAEHREQLILEGKIVPTFSDTDQIRLHHRMESKAELHSAAVRERHAPPHREYPPPATSPR